MEVQILSEETCLIPKEDIQNTGETKRSEHLSNRICEAKKISVEHKKLSNHTTECMKTRNNSFECNICFQTCVDPVVTQCGHLYW